MESLTNLSRSYDELWAYRDPRMDGWPFMGGLSSTIYCCIAFVLISKVWGPWFMANREPYNIKGFLLVYNVAQILLNVYIVAGGMYGGWWFKYKLVCQEVDYSDDPKAIVIMHATYVYYISKFIDFIDTFCFIARKKFGHLSALHMIHHTIMPISVWPGVRWAPGGHGTLAGLLNAIVHIIMYTYYLIAAMGPKYRKYIWWKRHVTNIQICQFLMIGLHSVLLMLQPTCGYPWQINLVILADASIFLVLFSQFYIKEYFKKGKKSVAKSD